MVSFLSSVRIFLSLPWSKKWIACSSLLQFNKYVVLFLAMACFYPLLFILYYCIFSFLMCSFAWGGKESKQHSVRHHARSIAGSPTRKWIRSYDWQARLRQLHVASCLLYTISPSKCETGIFIPPLLFLWRGGLSPWFPFLLFAHFVLSSGESLQRTHLFCLPSNTARQNKVLRTFKSSCMISTFYLLLRR